MSQTFTASDICGRALRAIGQWPTSESAPDGEHLREAMIWLDLIMAQFAGSTRVFRLVTETLDVPITNGTQSYDLEDALDTDLPLDRVQFPVEAWLEDDDGNRTALEIASKTKFENVSLITTEGTPYRIHIDRLDTPTLRIYPTPATTDSNTYTIKLVVQTYAPNVAPSGVTGSRPSASVEHNFAQSWQRFLVSQLSHDLGAGPITKIGEQSLTRFAGMAAQAKTELEAFENREHDTEPPICEPWGTD